MDKQKKQLYKIIVALILFFLGFFLKNETAQSVLYLAAYVLAGYDVLLKAVKNISKGKVFDENFLMAIASIGSIVLSDYAEGAAVMLFYQVGEYFQSYAVNKSRKSIGDLMDICPDYANIEKDGQIIQVDPDDIEIGNEIIVKPGEKVPLDGIIINGNSTLDTSALTGESVPREVCEGDEILSGCINLNGILRIKVTKEFDESTAAKILELIENASSEKSKAENFITVFARYYTPIVVTCALLLAVLPPLILGEAFSSWIYRALIFLVISCPCALVISIPLGFFGGIGAASSSGVLVKGSNYLEALSKSEIMVFDKTGTLTKGVFKVEEINNEDGVDVDELIEITAYGEAFSNHPIALSVKERYGKDIDNNRVNDVKELAGFGVKAVVDEKEVLVGKYALMKENNIDASEADSIGTVLYVSKGGKFLGSLVLRDEIKEDSKDAVKLLKDAGIKKTVMLTGDKKEIGEYVGKELGLDEVYTELLPIDKVNKVKELIDKRSENGKLVFVGDGLNDAPVLTMADIGIAMGGLGSDAAIEASDIVIMTDEPSKIMTGYKISKKTLTIVKENIFIALFVKIGVMALGALGLANMWEAIFADVGVAVIAILNSIRVLRYRG
ncbi:heavy metal translocating P-type ATPase [Anaerofustis stercorihominis]|uniref:heavy metal translocating P-type ATPase n=1 Tax=Anaerofustis stercorihominis TaxID=214853 RepID=UPI00214B873F|nr:heavy metal translocating P-type ATPase [Anaerofustis stercorihominis]MCR2032873.1 heavy metal translocating P-type ATPase [Anaerofustis stercorihominis]